MKTLRHQPFDYRGNIRPGWFSSLDVNFPGGEAEGGVGGSLTVTGKKNAWDKANHYGTVNGGGGNGGGAIGGAGGKIGNITYASVAGSAVANGGKGEDGGHGGISYANGGQFSGTIGKGGAAFGAHGGSYNVTFEQAKPGKIL